jgi:imidazoleglycerol-phosphate dehydratase
MFDLLAKHGHFDLTVKAKGDTHIDQHHLVEDLGIALGEAIAQAVGNKAGITRYGNFLLPMDETLSYVALDLSNRPYFVWKVKLPMGIRIGGLEGDLLEHFFESVAMNARMNLPFTRAKKASRPAKANCSNAHEKTESTPRRSQCLDGVVGHETGKGF